MTLLKIFGIYLLLINLVALYLYWNDKRRAKKGKWRISENTLLMLAFMGGSVGALTGMHVFRHKTKHWKFKIFVPLCLILQIALVIYLLSK